MKSACFMKACCTVELGIMEHIKYKSYHCWQLVIVLTWYGWIIYLTFFILGCLLISCNIKRQKVHHIVKVHMLKHQAHLRYICCFRSCLYISCIHIYKHSYACECLVSVCLQRLQRGIDQDRALPDPLSFGGNILSNNGHFIQPAFVFHFLLSFFVCCVQFCG